MLGATVRLQADCQRDVRLPSYMGTSLSHIRTPYLVVLSLINDFVGWVEGRIKAFFTGQTNPPKPNLLGSVIQLKMLGFRVAWVQKD